MEGPQGNMGEKKTEKVKHVKEKGFGHWKTDTKVGAPAMPFYDGLVEFAVCSPSAVN